MCDTALASILFWIKIKSVSFYTGSQCDRNKRGFSESNDQNGT